MTLSHPGTGAPTICLAPPKETLKSFSPARFSHSLLDFLTPEILHRRPNKPLKPTAWLDGLRGWAAFSVVCLHLCVYTHPYIEHCYGSPMDEGQMLTTPGAWPFVRLFFSGGHFAVMLFFSISGYVIAMRLLQLLHEGRTSEFLEAFHSAVVRRPLRLYLPVIWSTLFIVFFWHVFGIMTPWPDRQSNLFWELISWARETGKFCDFYRMGFLYTYYNIHSWTIPVELRGSMYLFVWLFALHQVDHQVRILAQVGMVLFLSIGSPGAWYACFFAGMLTAELDMLANEAMVQVALPWDGAFKTLRRRKWIRMSLLHVMLVAGFYLGGQPSDSNQTQEEILGTCRGWKTLNKMIPSSYEDEHGTFRWFWLFWAAWMTLVAIKEIPWAKKAFEIGFSQYLGKHSFALYLVHGPLIGLVGERLFYLTGVKKIEDWDTDTMAKWGYYVNRWYDASWWPFSNRGSYGMEPNFLVCQVVCVVVSLYVAEMATKAFDVPSVKVSRWAYGMVSRGK